MRKRYILLTFSMFTLSCGLMCSCKGQTGADSEFSNLINSENVAVSTEESVSSEEISEEETKEEKNEEKTILKSYSLPMEIVSPNKKAFYELIENERDKIANSDVLTEEEWSSQAESYFFCDYDLDGEEEMGIKRGTCEADYHYDVYDFNGETVDFTGTLPAGHSVLYSNPEGGFVSDWGHMGYESIETFTIEKSEWVTTEVYSADLNENPNMTWAKVSDYVPGAEEIPLYRIAVSFPFERTFFTASDTAELSQSSVEVMDILKDTVYNNGVIYVAPFDSYEVVSHIDEVKEMNFEDYLKSGVFAQFSSKDALVKEYVFADLNYDGQSEMLLKEVSDGQAYFTMLSYQNGAVYAYPLDNLYCDEMEIYSISGRDEIFLPDYESMIQIFFNINEMDHYFRGKADDVASKEKTLWSEY